jgi:hypothetical protein
MFKKFLLLVTFAVLLFTATSNAADSLYIRNTGWSLAGTVRLYLEHVSGPTQFTNTLLGSKLNCTSWDTTIALPDYQGYYRAVFMIQYTAIDPFLPYEIPYYASIKSDTTLNTLVRSIAIYNGAGPGYVQTLYPLDGSAIKDSAVITDSLGTRLGVVKFYHTTDPAVIDSIKYHKAP